MPHSYPEVRRSRVALTVTLLFVGTIGVLAATADMGFARDEGFYFRYGRDYARWFARVERASDTEAVHAALARDAVVGTWIGNFEHPPLMKSAFASAWRHLSRKDREVSLEARPGADGRLLGRVQRVESADGFEVGAEVVLLAPLAQGVSQADPSRATAVGTVVERAAGVPIVAFTTEDPLRLRALCAPTQVGARHGGAQQGEAQQGEVQQGGGPSAAAGVPITRCQVRERRLLGVTGEASAMRWVAFVVTALAVILTFLLGLELFGYDAGLCGALLFLFVPRHFYHAHLLTFDMAIVAATLATLYAFWRSLADRRWAVAAGVAWGLALLTKHNAFFIPVPLTLWWLWSHRADLALGRVGWRPTLSLPALPVALLVMPAVALPMLFVFWPKLWFDPFRAVQEYFAFHLEHDHYVQFYFGAPLEVPPFPIALPTVLTLMTVPVALSALVLIGVAREVLSGPILATARRGRGAFLLFNGLTPLALISLPSTPIFGGVKHWMTGMPLLLLFAGAALTWLAAQLARRVPTGAGRTLAVAALVALVFAAPIRASVRSAAFGTAYYNPTVAGGGPGAADMGMMRLYWGYTTRQALGWLNAHAPRNARVFWQNTTLDAVQMYAREGLLRADLRAHGSERGADVALIEPQRAFAELDRRTREAMGVAGPAALVTFDGVPMLRIYSKAGTPVAE